MTHFDPVTARLILALARDGSIARTAERESIAPSAISRRVADLEAKLGTVLFDRSASGVRPTAAGTAYADGCRKIFREISDLATQMSGFSSGSTGQLRIASTNSALSGRLPELLARYVAAHPEVKLDIREMTSLAAVTALEDAQVDIAICADNYDLSGFDVDVFEDDAVWVIASPEHVLAQSMVGGTPLPFEQAIAHEVVGVHHAGALDRLIKDAARKAGRTLGARVHVETFPALVRMVEAGFGIGFLRNTSLHLLAGTDLVHTPLDESWAHRKLLLVRRKRVQLSASVDAFVALSVETYRPTR